jgi:hypothetical protein
MNGAEALVATAASTGVEICFANPGLLSYRRCWLWTRARPARHPLLAGECGEGIGEGSDA